MRVPRPEHPQPQMQRKQWQNLNGEWEFEFDFGNSGEDRKLYLEHTFPHKILVPFCPESKLSGIEYKDYMPAIWYKRNFVLNDAQKKGKIYLHFGAVDYAATVWVNGKCVGEHRGGFSSFVFDITEFAEKGENNIVVRAQDDSRSGKQPRGKQSCKYQSEGCEYTRTTGIWQTVWLEFVPTAHIKSLQYYPNIVDTTLTIKATVSGDGIFAAKAFYEGRSCGVGQAEAMGDTVILTIPLNERHLWEPGKGCLYELKLKFGEDEVESYFGLREIRIKGEKVLINGKPVFQRLVLDQGYYPDGIYTAPEEKDLERDILLALRAGFNGARLHQKVFEPRFLYHCDRLGYLVWGESGNWGLDYSMAESLGIFLPEWMEVLERDFNHPSIVGWCPFNETWDYMGRKQDDNLLRIVYRMTKIYDTTRPCIDTSGAYHVETDIYDLHDYEQDPEKMKENYEEYAKGGALKDNHPTRQKPVKGVPVFISEYGGIRWDTQVAQANDWGYGETPETENDFIERYKGLTNVLIDNSRIAGYCYTQLYDVEQEINGLYTYHRAPKFDMEIFRKINGREAEYES